MTSRARGTSLHSGLFALSTGQPAAPRATYAAQLLAGARRTVHSKLQTLPIQAEDVPILSPYDCIPVVRADGHNRTIDLRHFPSGCVARSIRMRGDVIALDYRTVDDMLACVAAFGYGDNTVQLSSFPNGRGSQNKSCVFHRYRGCASAVAIAPGKIRVAVGGAGRTDVLDAPQGAVELVQAAALQEPDGAVVKSTRFCGPDDVICGTSKGQIRRWDLRVPLQDPVWSLQLVGRKTKIEDMLPAQDSEELYVVVGGRTEGFTSPWRKDVEAWDMRAGLWPVREFKAADGSVNFDARIDVDETGTGGLLAAGVVTKSGNDYKTSICLWDCHRGGEPLRTISLHGGRALRNKLVGWDGRGACSEPGILVETEETLQVFEIVARADSDQMDSS